MKYKQHFQLKLTYSKLFKVVDNEDEEDKTINNQIVTAPTKWHDIELPNYFQQDVVMIQMILKLQVTNTLWRQIQIKTNFEIYHGLFLPEKNIKELNSELKIGITYPLRVSFEMNKPWVMTI